ncbi:magnesium/cobalt transporter CorA [Myroides sp. LJL119]
MKRIKYKKNRKLQPNSLEYCGPFSQVAVSMELFVYQSQGVWEYKTPDFNTLKPIIKKATSQQVIWFNIHGLHNITLLENIGNFFGIQSYIMAEILNFSRRTRVEEIDDLLFFSVKAVLPMSQKNQSIHIAQISFILKQNSLLCFQEVPDTFFDIIRQRIRLKIGQVRYRETSFLLYALLDVLVDDYIVSLDLLEEKVEQVLLQAKNNHKKEVLVKVEELTQDIQDIKRAIIPFKEILHNLQNHPGQDSTISPDSLVFFSRLQYRSNEALDQVEYNLNKLDSATNYYFASQSNRMNQIMKVLTIVSVVFIPLTFIAGIYGMNFENMPELSLVNGYYFTLAAMLILALVMLGYFKWKKWF